MIGERTKAEIKKNVGAKLPKTRADAFHKRCIDYDTSMQAVVEAAVNTFMDTHPEKKIVNAGIS